LGAEIKSEAEVEGPHEKVLKDIDDEFIHGFYIIRAIVLFAKSEAVH
jgi:hypothetical protein